LVAERASGQLLRKASLPPDNPAVSATLARRAMEQQGAFIWSKNMLREQQAAHTGEVAAEWLRSIDEHHIESAMCAPLLWKGQSLGVVCLDNNQACGAFSSDDLKLLQASAHTRGGGGSSKGDTHDRDARAPLDCRSAPPQV
jgi:GAF domain-containing protein